MPVTRIVKTDGTDRGSERTGSRRKSEEHREIGKVWPPRLRRLYEAIAVVGMVGLIEAGSVLPVELLHSERVSQDCCFVDVGVVVPELSPVVSARVAAVPMFLPAIAEVFSSAVFAEGGGGGCC